MITNKIRNIEPMIKNNYKTRNNLTIDLRNSLKSWKELVRQKKVVICRSDKDGKIIIINHSDYNKLIEKDLKTYTQLDTGNHGRYIFERN